MSARTEAGYRRAQYARMGLHEDAKWARATGMSAAEWEERVAEQASDSAELVGARGVEAIVQIVWLRPWRRS